MNLKSSAALLTIYSTLLLASIICYTLAESTKSSIRSSNSLSPEPCYPSPCPSLQEIDAIPRIGDFNVIPAEFYGDGMETGSSQGAPPKTPAPAVVTLSSSSTAATTPAAAPAVSIAKSIIILSPPPKPFADINIRNDDGCCEKPDATVEAKKIAGMQKIRDILSRINTIDHSVDEHDEWLLEAKKAVEKVNSLIKDTEQTRNIIKQEEKELLLQKDEVSRQIRRDQLESDLKQAADNLNQLEVTSKQFQRADTLMTRAKDGVQHKIEEVASKLQIAKDKLAEKLEQFQDENNKLVVVAKQYKDYYKQV